MFQSGPDRVEYNRVGPSRGHKIYFFRVRSGSGQDITGQYGIGVPKTLPRRTLVSDVVHNYQVHGHGNKYPCQNTNVAVSSFPMKTGLYNKFDLSGDIHLLPILELLETEGTCVCETTYRHYRHVVLSSHM